MARRWRLERTQVVSKPREEVFSFFSDARNLARLTPSFLDFEILTPGPLEMKEGTLIDYSIRLYGVSMRWKTRIDVFQPERRFIDTQLVGPYRYWHHSHEFEDAEGGTLMRDVVDYEFPFGPFGSLAGSLFVRRSLDRIFDFRRKAVIEVFGGGDAPLP